MKDMLNREKNTEIDTDSSPIGKLNLLQYTVI